MYYPLMRTLNLPGTNISAELSMVYTPGVLEPGRERRKGHEFQANLCQKNKGKTKCSGKKKKKRGQ